MYRTNSLCEIHNKIAKQLNETLDFEIDDREMTKFNFCGVVNNFQCNKTNCAYHV